MPVWALQLIWWKLTTVIIVITLEVKVHDYEATIMSLRSDVGSSHYGLFNWSRVNNRHV